MIIKNCHDINDFEEGGVKKVIATDLALQKIAEAILAHAQANAIGLLIGVEQTSCAGNKYTLDIVDSTTPLDPKNYYSFTQKNSDILIFTDKKIYGQHFDQGLTIDYIDTATQQGFKIINPKEKGRCGCGESFSTE